MGGPALLYCASWCAPAIHFSVACAISCCICSGVGVGFLKLFVFFLFGLTGTIGVFSASLVLLVVVLFVVVHSVVMFV